MRQFRRLIFRIAAIIVALGLETQSAFAVVQVPVGNRNAKQPPIPYGAVSRTRATNGSFQGKYEKIRDMLASDRELIKNIKSAASQYGIDPIHIIGALVGEHTYNVDALDRLQTYYVKAISYFNSDIKFAYESEKVTNFVNRPEFAKCAPAADSYDLWSCREAVWRTQFRGKNLGGKTWPDERFGRVFFQPYYAGQTFGLGQLNPLTALRVTDRVAKVSSKRRLSANNASQVYKTIMDPDSTLQYMAAVLVISIEAYREIAGYDISNNPGITATLYNLGDVRNRARQLRQKNEDGQVLPGENYYGWLVNQKRSELEALLR